MLTKALKPKARKTAKRGGFANAINSAKTGLENVGNKISKGASDILATDRTMFNSIKKPDGTLAIKPMSLAQPKYRSKKGKRKAK